MRVVEKMGIGPGENEALFDSHMDMATGEANQSQRGRSATGADRVYVFGHYIKDKCSPFGSGLIERRGERNIGPVDSSDPDPTPISRCRLGSSTRGRRWM